MPYLKLEGSTEEICNNVYKKIKSKQMTKNKIITLILIVFATITNAQNYFKAKVLDSESNEALIGATLLLQGANNGVSTDVNGLATLNNIPNGEQTIVITFIG